MPVKNFNFIVVDLPDLDGYGFDEHTLPLLVSLVDCSEPDCRTITHLGVHAFYLSSDQARSRVDKLIADARMLRESNKRYKSLGIGVAEGPLLAEFTWSGRLKKNGRTPLGAASSQAMQNAKAEPNSKP